MDGIRFYESEYEKLKGEATRDHASLVGIFECDDRVYYDLDANEQCKELKLDGFVEVTFPLDDDLDFSADPTLENGNLGAGIKRPANGTVGGCASVIERQGERRTMILMRASWGGNWATGKKCELWSLKVGAIAHETGHVDDIEKGIHWKRDSRSMVGSEVYAHQYACRALMERSCFFALENYLNGVVKMMKAPSEYVRLAAEQMVKSEVFKRYRKVVREHKDSWQ